MKHIVRAAMVCAVVAGAAMTSSHEAHAQGMRREAAIHPRIAASIHALEAAREELQSASHDFGGHKASAIRAIDAALVELRAALEFRGAEDRRR